jgi:deoxycytidylate deaminase
MNETVTSTMSSAIERACMDARKSSCRSKRGAAVWEEETGLVLSSGYNAPPYGGCRGTDECKAQCGVTAIHAEQQALLWLGSACIRNLQMLHVKVDNASGLLVPSGQPSCVECAKLMVARGIRYMWLYVVDGWVQYGAKRFYELSVQNSRTLALCRAHHGLTALDVTGTGLQSIARLDHLSRVSAIEKLPER